MGRIQNFLHIKAPGNWINDPNGLIYYRGKYHLFYQYFPYGPMWGTMHWGHAVSDDLLHWEHLGIALFPTKEYDRNGVFSGSALEKDGTLQLYYSAVRYLKTDGENIHLPFNDCYETSQAMVVSPDGFSFDNWKSKRQIIPVIRDEKIAHATHTRDPKVWFENKSYYMILGSTAKEQAGRVVFFRSPDGENWSYAAQCRHERFGRIVECPDLFRLGERYVFIASPMHIEKPGTGYEHHSLCALADFDPQTCSLDLPGEFQYVDCGKDLYAPQTNLDQNGRRVLVAWMRMPIPVETDGQKPWSGMLCQPRVVEEVNGHIYFRVHPEVDRCFRQRVENISELDFKDPFRLWADLKEGEHLNIGGYRIWLEQGCLKTDRSQVFEGIKGVHTASNTPKSLSRCRLDIFVDQNLIEIFINDGEYVLSNIVYGLENTIEGPVTGIYTGS